MARSFDYKGLLYSPEVLGGIGLLTAGLSGQNPAVALPQLMQGMKLVYEDEFQRALQEDGSASSTYITPKAYYPGT